MKYRIELEIEFDAGHDRLGVTSEVLAKTLAATGALELGIADGEPWQVNTMRIEKIQWRPPELPICESVRSDQGWEHQSSKYL